MVICEVIRFVSLVKPSLSRPLATDGKAYRYHAMVKPSGSDCNLDCSYCFYLHKSDLLDHGKQSRMSDEILEQHIRQYIEAQTGDSVVFSWQGGEPTVMGLRFFEKVVALQEKYKKTDQRIENDLQTNGILLDDEWIAFLKQHDFLVGLSIDGPRELHDKHRFNKGGQPTFDRVMRAAERLHVADVPYAVLCVVNNDNVAHPREVYRFLADACGTFRIQFTPCVEPKSFKHSAPSLMPASTMPRVGSPECKPGHPLSIVTDWTVDAEAYGNFLCAVWREWLTHDVGRIQVNLFENAVAIALGLPSQMCVTSEMCGKALAVEHDGEVFSCDHFVYPEFRLGNLKNSHEFDMAFSVRQQEFGWAKSKQLPSYCRACPHLRQCWGECPKNRLLRTPDGEPGLNFLCPAFKQFFSYIGDDLASLVSELKQRGFDPATV